MSAVLLDTHALLWWQASSPRLSVTARAALEAAAERLVSPVTWWEIATLVRCGRVGLDRPVARWVQDVLATDQVEQAEVTSQAAVLAGELSHLHGDPADRLIYATAATRGLTLVSKDEHLTRAAAVAGDVTVVW